MHHKTGHSTIVNGLADTGAESNLWSWREFRKAGFRKEDLIHMPIRISGADGHPFNIIGAFKATFSGTSETDRHIQCDMVYVSDSVTGFFLSVDTLEELGIIDQKFPAIGAHPRIATVSVQNEEDSIEVECPDS